MKKIFLLLWSLAISCMMPMPAEAQFLKKLGKALETIAKAGENSNSPSASSSSSVGNSKPRYTIHETANTKKMIIRGGASELCPFSCGVALVNPRYGQWFVIDKQGNKLFELPQGYSPRGETFDNGRLMITSSTDLMSDWNIRIIDTKGQIIKDFGKVKSTSSIIDGVARITLYERSQKKTIYVDSNGNILSRTLPASKLFRLHDGLRIFGHDTGLSTTGPWGFCDAKCNIVIPAQFKNVDDFHNGLAAVQTNDGLWGFIDKTGHWVIQPQFSNFPSGFEGPYSMVKDKSGRTYFMNKQGEFVWKEGDNTNIDIRRFLSNGYAIWTFDGARNTALINSQFKVHAMIKSDNMWFGNGELVDYNENYFQWKWGGAVSLVDWNGNTLMEFDSDYTTFSDGMFNQGRSCYFNDKGEIIIKFEDTQF